VLQPVILYAFERLDLAQPGFGFINARMIEPMVIRS
jgi:hypothetical protein